MVLSGRFLLLTLLCLIPVVLWPGGAVIGGCLLVLAVMVAVDLLAAGSPRTVVVERDGDSSVRLGQTAHVGVLLTQHGSRAVNGSVRDGWQPTAGALRPEQPVRVPAGERRRIDVQLSPRRRGTLRTQMITLRSWGPLGLAARQVTHPAPGQLTVLPPFHSRKQLPSRLARLREMDGRSAVNVRGAGHEFDSLRDYVHGDDVRSIDWRATARRQDLVVRTWRPERDRRVVIVLDSSRISATRVGDETRFDTGIEACLLLAALASAGGDRVEMLAVDRTVRARVSSAQRGNLLHGLVTSLADVHPTLLAADWSRIPAEVAQVARQRALVVLVTSLDAAAVQEGLFPMLPALTQHHQVLLASVTDPELAEMAQGLDQSVKVDSVSATFNAAAAERSLLEQHRLAQLLAGYGVEVVQDLPHRLPATVADTYLRLKAAGRL